jgi:hypothetical protein
MAPTIGYLDLASFGTANKANDYPKTAVGNVPRVSEKHHLSLGT